MKFIQRNNRDQVYLFPVSLKERIEADNLERMVVSQKQASYKRRQAIVEQPYGPIMWQWGFSYILTKKGKARASVS